MGFSCFFVKVEFLVHDEAFDSRVLMEVDILFEFGETETRDCTDRER